MEVFAFVTAPPLTLSQTALSEAKSKEGFSNLSETIELASVAVTSRSTEGPFLTVLGPLVPPSVLPACPVAGGAVLRATGQGCLVTDKLEDSEQVYSPTQEGSA